MRVNPLPGQTSFVDHPIPEYKPKDKNREMSIEEWESTQCRSGVNIVRLEADIRNVDAAMKAAKVNA